MSYQVHFSEELIHRLIQLIVAHTGLNIREQDKRSFCQKLEARIKSLKLLTPESYYKLLEADSEQSHQEWRQLMLILTTLETYFFRDQGQFSLLRNHLLPQLIEQKKQAAYLAGNSKPSLRIWSAGCSTGEEPYSLAILLKEMMINWDSWDIFILGTDINLEAIEKAKEAIYSSWSFRMVDSGINKQYFQHKKNGYKLDDSIRQKVKFQYGNLVKDIFPSQNSNIYEMDLIICRNVFVYFDNPSIALVLEKFSQTLAPKGYLLTGHAELYGQDLHCLQSKMFPDSVVYQRHCPKIVDLAVQARSQLPIQSVPTAVKQTTTNQSLSESKGQGHSHLLAASQVHNKTVKSAYKDRKIQESIAENLLKEAKSLFLKKAYVEAIKTANKLIELQPKNFDAYCIIAQIYANLGDYPQAYSYAQQAIKLNSFADFPYYLLAHISEEQGDLEAAKDFLKRIIYLSPDSSSAYLDLANLYEKEGDTTRANKMREVALALLKNLPHDVTVKQQGNLTAEELILQVKKLLKN